MPLQLPLNELAPIREALLNAFSIGNLSLLLSDHLRLNIEDISPGPVTRPQRYQAILLWLNERRRVPELLSHAHDAVPTDTELTSLYDKYRDDILEMQFRVDPYRASRLTGQGMVDREDLRRELIRLKDDNARILLVSGRPMSGKTYTRILLDHVANRTGDFKLLVCDLRRLALTDPKGENKVDPDALAIRLAKDLVAPPPDPIGERTGAAWAFDTCEWLVGVLRAKPEVNYWLFVDHLSKVALRAGVEELLIQIASRVDETLANLRLILIDYSPKVEDALRALELQRPTRREEVPPVKLEDLTAFFKRVYEERELLRQISFTPEEVSQDVLRCWTATAEDDPARLKRMGEEIRLVLDALFP